MTKLQINISEADVPPQIPLISEAPGTIIKLSREDNWKIILKRNDYDECVMLDHEYEADKINPNGMYRDEDYEVLGKLDITLIDTVVVNKSGPVKSPTAREELDKKFRSIERRHADERL